MTEQEFKKESDRNRAEELAVQEAHLEEEDQN